MSLISAIGKAIGSIGGKAKPPPAIAAAPTSPISSGALPLKQRLTDAVAAMPETATCAVLVYGDPASGNLPTQGFNLSPGGLIAVLGGAQTGIGKAMIAAKPAA